MKWTYTVRLTAEVSVGTEWLPRNTDLKEELYKSKQWIRDHQLQQDIRKAMLANRIPNHSDSLNSLGQVMPQLSNVEAEMIERTLPLMDNGIDRAKALTKAYRAVWDFAERSGVNPVHGGLFRLELDGLDGLDELPDAGPNSRVSVLYRLMTTGYLRFVDVLPPLRSRWQQLLAQRPLVGIARCDSGHHLPFFEPNVAAQRMYDRGWTKATDRLDPIGLVGNLIGEAEHESCLLITAADPRLPLRPIYDTEASPIECVLYRDGEAHSPQLWIQPLPPLEYARLAYPGQPVDISIANRDGSKVSTLHRDDPTAEIEPWCHLDEGYPLR